MYSLMFPAFLLMLLHLHIMPSTVGACQPVPFAAHVLERVRLRLKQAIEAPNAPELRNLTDAQVSNRERGSVGGTSNRFPM